MQSHHRKSESIELRKLLMNVHIEEFEEFAKLF